MRIQGKFYDGKELYIYTNYSRSEHAGAGGCFQIVDILVDDDISILNDLKIDVGVHYATLKTVLHDLEITDNEISVKEVIC